MADNTVLAPNAKLRPQIIPGRPGVSDDLGEATHQPVSARMSWARLLTKSPGAVLNGRRLGHSIIYRIAVG